MVLVMEVAEAREASYSHRRASECHDMHSSIREENVSRHTAPQIAGQKHRGVGY